MQEIVDLGSDHLAPMRLLVASIRSADEIATLAAKGCNTFTIAPVSGGGGLSVTGWKCEGSVRLFFSNWRH